MPDDDRIGYKNPPKATRFRPGASGNPNGRPKRSPTLGNDLREELRSVTVVKEGGSEVQLSKQQAIAKVLVKAAVEGNLRAIDALLKFVAMATENDEERELSPQEADLLDKYETTIHPREDKSNE